MMYYIFINSLFKLLPNNVKGDGRLQRKNILKPLGISSVVKHKKPQQQGYLIKLNATSHQEGRELRPRSFEDFV